MSAQRLTELNILGYRIDRISPESSADRHYAVIGPERDELLGTFADRPAAERFVIMRELRSLEARPRSPAY